MKGSQNTEEISRDEIHQDTPNNPDNLTQNVQIPEGFGGFQNTQILAQNVEDSNSFFSSSHTSATVTEVTTVHEEKNAEEFSNLIEVS